MPTDENLYDAVQYPNRSHAQTHLQRLGALGVLRGLAPADPAACRVIEIGCGGGANLLAMAAAYPESEFTGVDLASSAIAVARQCAEELGLGNVFFECASIDDIEARALGKFDYFLAHGIYSWIPDGSKQALLALASGVLAPKGLAYISYNAYPGCHFREMSRRMMGYHTRHLEEPKERISQGRALLQLISRAREGKTPEGYDAVLAEELRHSQEYQEASFFHDDLSDINNPFYFHEFMADAADHGLAFVSEADLRDMQIEGFPPEILSLLRQMEAADELAKEQYLDFLKGRRFRQTLLCPASAAREPRLDAMRLDRLHLAAQISRCEAPADGDPNAHHYAGPKGSRVAGTDPAIQLALERLSEAWPQGLPFSELCTEETSGKVRAFLAEAAMGGVLDLRLTAAPVSWEPGEFPRASRFARWQARNESIVTTLIHQRVRLEDAASQRLLMLLDGTRDVAALAAELARSLIAEKAEVCRTDGTPVSGEENLTAFFREEIPAIIQKFCRLALIPR